MPEIVPSFLTLVIVIAVARFFGLIFRKMGQPSVMGEVLGGIILGPSVVGYFFPGFTTSVFHPEAMVFLKHVAEIGITLYLFVMGLEIDLPRLRQSARSAVLISQFSIILPFALGVLLAGYLYSSYAPAGVTRLSSHFLWGCRFPLRHFRFLRASWRIRLYIKLG